MQKPRPQGCGSTKTRHAGAGKVRAGGGACAAEGTCSMHAEGYHTGSRGRPGQAAFRVPEQQINYRYK